MQQGRGSHSHQYTHMGGASASASASASAAADQSQHSSQMVVEEASPISSRPPASTGNLDEFMPGSSGGAGGYSDMDALATAAAAGDDADRGGGGGGGNRWPRQETLALLRIRSEMDAAFRDASVKGPLWEDVSRKLAELGYKRSAKKCKEKFENVDKYYKRTKEGRAGRQDGKAYKFFSELEALHNTSVASQLPPPPMAATTAATATSFPPGIGFSSPMPISSVRPLHPTTSISPVPGQPQTSHPFLTAEGGARPFAASPMGPDFSSDSSSSSPETEDDEDDIEGSDLEGEPSNVAGSSRKRKRGGGSSRRMMEFFEGLMRQVMQKQEAMQQRFLEAIEKREQDRLVREEAWRRQEMTRLAREHEIMAQERAVSASRDASIMAFLQKVTGQTIQLPTTSPAAIAITSITPTQPSMVPMPQPVHVPMPSQQPLPSYQQQQKSQQPSDRPRQAQSVNVEAARHQPVISTDVVLAAVPEQQVRVQDSGGRSSEPPSSRWPKTEVLALIKLRSGLESRYQEAGPKGPLWEEISAGMQRMGYRRSAKRCKEKWENINKYFKKVKESNKKRPEDAKTCPYFHELDALYQKKIFGGSSSGSIGGTSVEGAGNGAQQVQHQLDAPVSGQELQPTGQTAEPDQPKDGGSSGQAAGNIEEAKEKTP
ncbi:trihelix transcription factor GTL1 isoform X2 [Punica granatum]|uniref:Trihelix transcription factor GTL1 isoform X2 n=1 Tax=Punica granatum TaxID=22663 RepID=A0A6P8CBV4_PUNGR|nr:trihelix transcription factor GTL1 isoform X2 [Punica granatum]